MVKDRNMGDKLCRMCGCLAGEKIVCVTDGDEVSPCLSNSRYLQFPISGCY